MKSNRCIKTTYTKEEIKKITPIVVIHSCSNKDLTADVTIKLMKNGVEVSKDLHIYLCGVYISDFDSSKTYTVRLTSDRNFRISWYTELSEGQNSEDIGFSKVINTGIPYKGIKGESLEKHTYKNFIWEDIKLRNNQYPYFSYPKYYGRLSEIINLDNDTNILDQFSENSITIDGIEYFSYVLKKNLEKKYKNLSLEFKCQTI